MTYTGLDSQNTPPPPTPVATTQGDLVFESYTGYIDISLFCYVLSPFPVVRACIACVCVYARARVCVCVCVGACVCMCVRVCACLCIRIFIDLHALLSGHVRTHAHT